jgi:hypothetical protein
MMTWYSGHGWGWCSVMVNIPVMVPLWAALAIAMVLAVRVAARRPSDPPAPTGTAYTRPKGMVAPRVARSETDDEFYRRLM